MTVYVTQRSHQLREKFTEANNKTSSEVRPVVFRANLSSNQLITPSTFTLYNMSDVKIDTYNGYDSQNVAYIIPVSGYYQHNFMQWWNSKPPGQSMMRIYVNGGAINSYYHNTGQGQTMSSHGVRYFEKGDSVQMYVHHNDASNQYIDNNDLNDGFSLHLIR